jgi:hypothetical protein
MINPILKQAKAGAREPFAGNRIGRLAGPENQLDDKSAKSRCGPPFRPSEVVPGSRANRQ